MLSKTCYARNMEMHDLVKATHIASFLCNHKSCLNHDVLIALSLLLYWKQIESHLELKVAKLNE